MSEEGNIDQGPKNNNNPEDVNENASQEQAIEQSKTQSKNMEVHKHPHHVTHKKNWAEYLLEFFMLFLAVFLGFIAENVREHQVEREREKELAVSFYNELKADSSALQIVIGNRQRKDAAFNYMKRYFADSNVALCSKAFSVNFFYTFATFSPSIFEPNDAILTQLKNSGSLRYFKGRELQELTGKISVAISNLGPGRVSGTGLGV